jgi:hypothetical protein
MLARMSQFGCAGCVFPVSSESEDVDEAKEGAFQGDGGVLAIESKELEGVVDEEEKDKGDDPCGSRVQERDDVNREGGRDRNTPVSK